MFSGVEFKTKIEIDFVVISSKKDPYAFFLSVVRVFRVSA